MPKYLDATTYSRLVDSLLNLTPDPVTGRVEADQIKLTLGEHGDVWPETIKERSEP